MNLILQHANIRVTDQLDRWLECARSACASMMAALRARVLERAARRLRRTFGEHLLRRPTATTGSRTSALSRR